MINAQAEVNMQLSNWGEETTAEMNEEIIPKTLAGYMTGGMR